MAPNPQCAALAAAKESKGLSYAQIAAAIGQTEQHVVAVCTGAAQPTQQEFTALAGALGITTPVPNTPSHAAK